MGTGILVFAKSTETGENLAREIGEQYDAQITCRDPADVFKEPLPDNPEAVFFAVSDMYDAEAARKYHALHGDVPLVIASGDAEYGVWSYSVAAGYFMTLPTGRDKIQKALGKCKPNT